MADDERLRALTVSIEANTKGLEKAVKRIEKQLAGDLGSATGKAKKSIESLEKAIETADRRMSGFGRSLVPSLGAIGAALSTREIISYAESWTKAKNALAVAGVQGEEQVKTLEKLYQLSQANASPLEATVQLYGRASMAAANLGASQAELIKLTDAVGLALKVSGQSSTEASGALLQLSQALQGNKIQSQEYNSLIDGMYPLLQAAAAGSDKWGGSVAKLTADVKAGKVATQDFFRAILAGTEDLRSKADGATQTIGQSLTKINNAMVKYVGETDSSLGASQRLVAGLNALADNFDKTADVVLKVASIVAGAFVGRAIVGMITKLGLGGVALYRFATALKTAAVAGSLASTVFTGVRAAAGPLGWIIGGTVVGALALFGTQSAEASAGARTYAEALKEIEEAAPKAADAIDGATAKMTEQARNSVTAGVAEGTQQIEEARQAVVSLFSEIIDNAPRRLITEEQLGQLGDLRDGLKNGTTQADTAKDALYALANSNPKFQNLADQLAPLLDTLAKAIGATDLLKNKLANLGGSGGPSFRESENASMDAYGKMVSTGQSYAAEAKRRAGLTPDQRAKEDEIARIKKELDAAGGYLSDSDISNLAATTVASRSSGRKSGGSRKDDYERATESITKHTAALVAETEAQRSINPLVDDYGYAVEKARAKQELLTAAQEAGKKITPELQQEIDGLADKYATASAEAEKLAKQQQEAAESAEFAKDILKDSLHGIVDALKDGKLSWDEFADVAVNALDKISDRSRDEVLEILIGV